MRRIPLIIAALKCTFFAVSLAAQTIPVRSHQAMSLSLEVLKPYFVDSNSSFATSVAFLTGRFPLSNTIALVADLPVAHHDYRNDFGFEILKSSTEIGNPYFGIELPAWDSPVFVELGFRLPLGTDRDEFFDMSRASQLATLIDPDRFEAFMLYDLSMVARFNCRGNLGSGFHFHLHGGWAGGGSTDGEYGPAGFQTIDYGVGLEYQIKQWSFLGAIDGYHLVDGSHPFLSRYHSFAGTTAYQVTAAANLELADFQPGLYFRIPADDFLDDEIHFVLGLSLGIFL